MELIFAFAAGLLTLINPCVLPVLPIVLGSALQASRAGPVALAAGMGLSFTVLGVALAATGGHIFLGEGGTTISVAQVAAIVMILFGLVMLVPQASARFSTATAGVSARADAAIDRIESQGVTGQFLGGALLGAVWSPCIGPTLGGAVAMASTGDSLLRAGAIMLAFSLGVAVVIVGLAYGARGLLTRNRTAMMRMAQLARPILGAAFVLVGTAILFQWHYAAESWLLDRMPIWLQDLSVAL